MVTQVVVSIFNADAEYNSSPKFLEIIFHRSAVTGYKLHQFQVSCAGGILSVHMTQQCHGRGKMNPFPGNGPVQTFCELGMITVVKLQQFSLSDIDPCAYGKLIGYHFPGCYIFIIVPAGEFCDP